MAAWSARLGGLGGLQARTLLADDALLGAADLGVGVGAHRRELGLELLGVGEHLEGLQPALDA